MTDAPERFLIVKISNYLHMAGMFFEDFLAFMDMTFLSSAAVVVFNQ